MEKLVVGPGKGRTLATLTTKETVIYKAQSGMRANKDDKLVYGKLWSLR